MTEPVHGAVQAALHATGLQQAWATRPTWRILDIQIDLRELMSRERAVAPRPASGYGRELFGWMRRAAGPADTGACALFEDA